jgi:hypothetical protein
MDRVCCGAVAWLREPSEALGGRSPLAAVASDPAAYVTFCRELPFTPTEKIQRAGLALCCPPGFVAGPTRMSDTRHHGSCLGRAGKAIIIKRADVRKADEI